MGITGVYSQIQNEFVLTATSSTNRNIMSDCKRDGHPLATVVFYTAIDSIVFETIGDDRIRSQKYKEELGGYVLCLDGVDDEWRYIQIDIRKKGFKTYQMEAIQIKNGEYLAFKLSPKNNAEESLLEKRAIITVYDKDYELLVGAVVKNKTNGTVYGSTGTDGTQEVPFGKKGEKTTVIVSHPSYSDSKEISVEAGRHDYKVYLRNYISPLETKNPRVRKLKPEKRTTEISVIGGTCLGLAMDFTWSYFLLGVGVDWLLLAPVQTTTSTLVNSGYTGNFTKTTTLNLSGSRTNVFLDLGAYFKYFSISCQVGSLCGTTVERTSLYDGWGYGLKDGDDLDVYWGAYEQRSFTNTTSDEGLYFTVTPQVKGYIPVGSKKTTSIAVGLGYTFIPSLNYYPDPGLSGSLGIHYRF